MLPDARTYDEAANTAFHQPVPEQLLSYLQKNKGNLTPGTDLIWEANGYKTSGTLGRSFWKISFHR